MRVCEWLGMGGRGGGGEGGGALGKGDFIIISIPSSTNKLLLKYETVTGT